MWDGERTVVGMAERQRRIQTHSARTRTRVLEPEALTPTNPPCLPKSRMGVSAQKVPLYEAAPEWQECRRRGERERTGE